MLGTLKVLFHSVLTITLYTGCYHPIITDEKLKAQRVLGHPGPKIQTLASGLRVLSISCYSRISPDFYLHIHGVSFRLLKLEIGGQPNEITCKQANSKNRSIN